MKPTAQEAREHLRDYYDLTQAELLEILRAPTHPAGLRDEFAKAALQGLLAAPGATGDVRLNSIEQYAIVAYNFADAMLEARAK